DSDQQINENPTGLLFVQGAGCTQTVEEMSADGERRIEVRHRLLRDVGDATPTCLPHLRLVREEILAVEQHAAPQDQRFLRQDPEGGERDLRLARAGLPDQAVNLTTAG